MFKSLILLKIYLRQLILLIIFSSLKLRKNREHISKIGNFGTDEAILTSSQNTANFCPSKVTTPKKALNVRFIKFEVLDELSTLYNLKINTIVLVFLSITKALLGRASLYFG